MAVALEEEIRDVNIDKNKIMEQKTFTDFLLLSLRFKLRIPINFVAAVKTMYRSTSHKNYSTFYTLQMPYLNDTSQIKSPCSITL